MKHDYYTEPVKLTLSLPKGRINFTSYAHGSETFDLDIFAELV